ncbi:MAG: V-type ATPase subunit [Acidaminobacteraceae bacterium]
MSSVIKFAAVNTKVRALERYLLSNKDYQNMIQSKNVTEIMNYLKEKTLYGEFLEDFDTQNGRVDLLEVRSRMFVFKRYEKLVHYFTGENKKLFKMLFMRYEVENLKLLIRAVYRNEDIERVSNELIESHMFSKIDYKRLGSSTNIEELINNLKGTLYFKLLKPYINENPNRLMFYMEMNLDRIYFKMLGKQIYKLPSSDQKPMLELLGKNTDILNIQWIYRGLKFYKLSPEELFNYSLEYGYIKFDKLKELCYSSSKEDFIEKLSETRYGFLFEDVATMDQFMERSMERYLYKVLINLKKQAKMNIMPSIIFMHELEFEMRDIFTLLEAKRYNFTEEETKGFLVRVIE